MLMIMLLSAVTSCSNPVDNYLSKSEKLVDKWKDKNELTNDEKNELKADLADLNQSGKDIDKDPELVKKMTPEQKEKLQGLALDMEMINLKSH